MKIEKKNHKKNLYENICITSYFIASTWRLFRRKKKTVYTVIVKTNNA